MHTFVPAKGRPSQRPGATIIYVVIIIIIIIMVVVIMAILLIYLYLWAAGRTSVFFFFGLRPAQGHRLSSACARATLQAHDRRRSSPFKTLEACSTQAIWKRTECRLSSLDGTTGEAPMTI